MLEAAASDKLHLLHAGLSVGVQSATQFWLLSCLSVYGFSGSDNTRKN